MCTECPLHLKYVLSLSGKRIGVILFGDVCYRTLYRVTHASAKHCQITLAFLRRTFRACAIKVLRLTTRLNIFGRQ